MSTSTSTSDARWTNADGTIDDAWYDDDCGDAYAAHASTMATLAHDGGHMVGSDPAAARTACDACERIAARIVADAGSVAAPLALAALAVTMLALALAPLAATLADALTTLTGALTM